MSQKKKVRPKKLETSLDHLKYYDKESRVFWQASDEYRAKLLKLGDLFFVKRGLILATRGRIMAACVDTAMETLLKEKDKVKSYD